MEDVMRYNRDILGKKISAKDYQKEEVMKKKSSFKNVDLQFLHERINSRPKYNQRRALIVKSVSLVFGVIIFVVMIWVLSSIDYTVKKESTVASESYHSVFTREGGEEETKTDYYKIGAIAQKTHMKYGVKHQASESYYPSGELFRTALYYYDTLIQEAYFFKTGDTIKNFDGFTDFKIHHVNFQLPNTKKEVKFDLFDYKIIPGTYQVVDVP
jgi:hypothetical protein